MNIDQIIDEAYKLYMPQDRYEITELATFVESHIRNRLSNKSGYNILEIGTKYGGTFYLWNQLNPFGMNISIDMSDGGIHGGIPDLEMDKRDLWFYERFANCHFIRGDSHDPWTSIELKSIITPNTGDILSDITSSRCINFLFIDGDHTYEGVKRDFEMYSQFVKSGGIIAFHDINDSEKHRSRNVHVSKFWQEIVESGKYETVEFNSNLDWAGIGVIVV